MSIEKQVALEIARKLGVASRNNVDNSLIFGLNARIFLSKLETNEKN